MPALPAEPFGDCAQLDKAQAFVKMSRMSIGGDYRIKLYHAKPMALSLDQTVRD